MFVAGFVCYTLTRTYAAGPGLAVLPASVIASNCSTACQRGIDQVEVPCFRESRCEAETQPRLTEQLDCLRAVGGKRNLSPTACHAHRTSTVLSKVGW